MAGETHSPQPKSTTLGKVRLVVFPGEMVNKDHEPLGHIYIVGGGGEVYEMQGGPAPGDDRRDRGGHTAEATPAGQYILDHAEHHTSPNWPMSVIPWGAKLREYNGEVQYQQGTKWVTATGPNGTVTQATKRFLVRSGEHHPFADVIKYVRSVFYLNGSLLPAWNMNDFGNWSWNLKRNGVRTPYFIHTEQDNEAEIVTRQRITLTQSHGCIHIHALDRESMIRKGYLKEGIAVEVKPYGDVGPPAMQTSVDSEAGVKAVSRPRVGDLVE